MDSRLPLQSCRSILQDCSLRAQPNLWSGFWPLLSYCVSALTGTFNFGSSCLWQKNSTAATLGFPKVCLPCLWPPYPATGMFPLPLSKWPTQPPETYLIFPLPVSKLSWASPTHIPVMPYSIIITFFFFFNLSMFIVPTLKSVSLLSFWSNW